MNLRYKISFSLIVTTLLPVSIMVLLVLSHVTSDAEQNAKQTIQNYLQLMSSKLTDEFSTSFREVEIYAQVDQIKSLDPDRFIPFLKKELRRQNGRYEKLLVSDLEGHLYNTVCGNQALARKCSFDDTNPNAKPKRLTSREYWQKTVGSNRSQKQVTYLSDPIISYSTGVSQLIVATSLFDDDNNLIGMVGASMEWDRIANLITDLSHSIFGQYSWQPKIMLISASGTYWHHWDKHKLVRLKRDQDGGVVKDAAGLPISETFSIYQESEIQLHLAHGELLKKQAGMVEFEAEVDQETHYLFYQPIPSSQYSIALQVSEREVNQISYELRDLYIVTLILVLFVFILAAILIAKSITKPIGRLVHQANRLKEGNYNLEQSEPGTDELSELSQTFAKMARVILDRQSQLEHSEERFELAMKGANDGLWDWDLAQNTVYYSPRWKNMLGYDEGELINDSNTYFNLMDHKHHTLIRKEIEAIRLSSGDSFNYKVQMRHKQGHLLHILTRGIVVRDKEGIATRFVGTHVDITEQTLNEEKIKKLNEDLEKTVKERTLKLEVANRHLKELAMLDMMLNIGNRRGLEVQLTKLHQAFIDQGESYSILLFDVDYFKKFNDLYGHQAGDSTLIQVVNRIKRELKNAEAIYRYGGEEFVCVLPHLGLEKAYDLAVKLTHQIEVLQITHDQSHFKVVTVSVGCAQVNLEDETWEQVISRSDKALYDAKAKGRNQVSVAKPRG